MRKRILSLLICISMLSASLYSLTGCSDYEDENGVLKYYLLDDFTYAVSGCTSLTSIKYCGTMEQWYSITKGIDWINDTQYGIVTFNHV